MITDTDTETGTDNDESHFWYPLPLNELQSLSMNQIIDTLLYQMQ